VQVISAFGIKPQAMRQEYKLGEALYSNRRKSRFIGEPYLAEDNRLIVLK
jgi:hypothetical protein